MILSFIIGLLFGSFYNVVAYRLLDNKSLVYPRSFCPNCKKQLLNKDLIPVISYILLKGKCRNCNAKISITYPLIEFLTGILFMLSYMRFNLTYQLFISLILVSVFVIVLITDLKEYIILDEVVITGSLLVLFTFISVSIDMFLKALLSGVIGFIFLYLLSLTGKILIKEEVLGGGDIKLMFFIGLIVGYENIFLVLFIASVLALIPSILIKINKKTNMIPFGPFLLLATILIYFLEFNLGFFI